MGKVKENKDRLKLPNIGEMLRKFVAEKRIRKAAWSRHQGVRKETITRYLKKGDMYLSTVFIISQVLNYNFIREIADALPADMPPFSVNPLQAELDEAKKENEMLKMKIEILESLMKKTI